MFRTGNSSDEQMIGSSTPSERLEDILLIANMLLRMYSVDSPQTFANPSLNHSMQNW